MQIANLIHERNFYQPTHSVPANQRPGSDVSTFQGFENKFLSRYVINKADQQAFLLNTKAFVPEGSIITADEQTRHDVTSINTMTSGQTPSMVQSVYNTFIFADAFFTGPLNSGLPDGDNGCLTVTKPKRGAIRSCAGKWQGGQFIEGHIEYNLTIKHKSSPGRRHFSHSQNMLQFNGHLLNGLFEGEGNAYLTNGALLQGVWSKGELNGIGKYTHVQNSAEECVRNYQGNFAQGKFHGFGQAKFGENATFKGEWVNNEPVNGVWERIDSEKNSITIYQGEIKNFCFHGQGTARFADGSSYEGLWQNGQPQGMGIITYADGATYKGEWEDGKRHGEGSLIYADGSVYTGKWQDGK